jgi:hypothetical protein
VTEQPERREQARWLSEQVREGALLVPYPGRWTDPERLDHGVLALAVDGEISRLLVDETTGTVLLADDSGRHRVNSSVAAFTACARVYTDAMREVASRGLDDGDHDDELGRIEQILVERCADADTALPGGPEDFWIVAAEEIGLGTAPFPRPTAPSPETAHAEAARTADRTLVALTDADRDRLFTAEQWKRLTSLGTVTLVRSPHLIEAAIELAQQTAAARGNPAPRPTVLVTTDATSLTPGLWAKLPALRLVCLLAPAAPEHVPPSGVHMTVLPSDADGEAVVDTVARGLPT